MPQSLAQIYLHLVFSTKNRVQYLRDQTLRQETILYIKGTCDGLKCPSVQTGGWEDHIHVLCRMGRTISIADLVKGIKTASSAWIKTKSRQLADFHWQLGYGAFSISPSHVDTLIAYIQNQEEHHRTETFQEEFRRICAKYEIEIDERYVWD
jgi:REP element-mobilizing transposase RayT